MFCPNCKSEYKAGIIKCIECGVKLVNELPEEKEEFVEFVKVFESSDPLLTALIKSILEDAGIEFFVNGEHMQSILGAKFSFAFGADVGNAEFMVSKEYESVALDLINNQVEQENKE